MPLPILLIHRLTPFVIGFLAVAGFLLVSLFPSRALLILPLLFVIEALLYAHLAQFRPRSFESWALIGTPLLLLLSGSFLFLFLGSSSLRLGLLVLSGFFLFLYAENLFGFVHLPVFYQRHSLQNLTVVLLLISVFFFSGSAFAVLMFVPVISFIWVVVILTPIVFALLAVGLWMGRMPRERYLLYTFIGVILYLELFIAVSSLPAVFLTSAALLTIPFYLFLGLSRAETQARVGRRLMTRYVGLALVTLFLIVVSSDWT